MSDKTISVVLCTCDGEKYIIEQLDSIMAQTRLPDEFVVCDDMSEDDTVNLVSGYLKRTGISYIISLNETRIGFVRNFEKAISLASGDYIALGDQDDIWLSNKLEMLCAALRNREEARPGKPALAFCDCSITDRDLNICHPSFFAYQRVNPVKWIKSKYASAMQNIVPGMCMMFNRELVLAAMPVPPKVIAHDWWLIIIAHLNGGLTYIRKSLVLYRQHNKNLLGSNQDTSISWTHQLGVIPKRSYTLNKNRLYDRVLAFPQDVYPIRRPHLYALYAITQDKNYEFLSEYLHKGGFKGLVRFLHLIRVIPLTSRLYYATMYGLYPTCRKKVDYRLLPDPMRIDLVPEHILDVEVPTILYILSSGFFEGDKFSGGGTQLHTWQMLNSRNEQSLVIYNDNNVMVLEEFVNGEHSVLKWCNVAPCLNPTLRPPDICKFYEEVLNEYDVGILHVQHFLFQSVYIVEAATSRGIPVVISLHDYFCLCPTFFLVNTKDRFCEGTLSVECHACCAAKTEVQFASMEQWRRDMQYTLELASELIAPSQGVADIFGMYYGGISITVIEHGTPFHPKRIDAYDKKDTFNVAFPGHATKTKGSDAIRYIIENCDDEEIRFHIFGQIVDPELQHLRDKRLIPHGIYAPGTLQDELKKNLIHAVVLPSLSAETFCLTLSEVWQCGVAVVASDLGALRSRINENGAGILISAENAGSEGLDAIIKLKSDPALLSEMCRKSREARQRTVTEMVNDYLLIYKRVFKSSNYVWTPLPTEHTLDEYKKENAELRVSLNLVSHELNALKASTFYKIYMRAVRFPMMKTLARITRKVWKLLKRNNVR